MLTPANNSVNLKISEPKTERPPDFSAVYTSNVDYVWRLLRRLGTREADLQDATQEVFVVVHRKLDEYDTQRPLKPWLAGITHRIAAQERRRAKHRREALTDTQKLMSDLPDTALDPEASAQVAERRRRVAAALDTLDPDRRVVFVMHEMEGLSSPEVAGAIQVPLNTIYSRLRSARLQFRGAIHRLRREEGEV